MSTGLKGSVTTHDGYELGDWEFFRERVEELATDSWQLESFLAEWQLGDYLDMSAEDIADDMALIIARLDGTEATA